MSRSRLVVTLTLLACLVHSAAAPAGETLYNGIVLPDLWPPRADKLTREVAPAPWLENIPKVIPIDVGRQLLVDDFLIEQTDLTRTFHQPTWHEGNPVLKPEKPWEKEGKGAFAAAFSDGVWYDPADRKFKMWYMAPYFQGTCLAVSDDGLRWQRPEFDVFAGTNRVIAVGRDSSTVWLDHFDRDPQKRFKMFTATNKGGWKLQLNASPDGIHWSEPLALSPSIGDRTTVFYNPFRKRWVYSLRIGLGGGIGRSRAYREHADARQGLTWTDADKVLWTCADKLDPRHPKYPDIEPQLYNLDATPYESLMIGLFAIHQGPPNGECAKLKIQKRNELLIGFSRDGFHWHRPCRERFLGVTEKDGDWNWGNMQSAGGGCLVVGDRLYFYVSGRARPEQFWDTGASMGVAFLRRDGFASLDAGASGGTLTTRPVRFAGKHLFVNAAAGGGELRAEVLDADGKVIAPFTRDACRPVKGDKTLAAVSWDGAADLSALAGKPVRFRFHLTSASLYAFWVSPAPNGASHGYVAAGGPGFTGPTDTVGQAAANR